MRGWGSAMADALHGPAGFYRAAGGPAAHFRTSAQSLLFARAVAELAGRCGLSTVVDIGAAGGELLRNLHALDPGLRLHGVEQAARPSLPASVGWSAALPDLSGALVVAHEWLDTVPVEVVESTRSGPRQVCVDGAGAEQLGGDPSADELAWLARWWPPGPVGSRAEVGVLRDVAWAGLVARAHGSVLLAVDYAHVRAARPAYGTLTGYRRGRQVPPVPDGSCDITAHVALDACAAAAQAAGAGEPLVLTQAEALRSLLPGPRSAPADRPVATGTAVAAHGAGAAGSRAAEEPAGALAWAHAAVEAAQWAELTDPAGPGGFSWLLQPVDRPLPSLRPPLLHL